MAFDSPWSATCPKCGKVNTHEMFRCDNCGKGLVLAQGVRETAFFGCPVCEEYYVEGIICSCGCDITQIAKKGIRLNTKEKIIFALVVIVPILIWYLNSK